MGTDIGFNSQTPSLPKGGGAVAGLGETFTPELSSGTGSYTIRLDSPNGPNDLNPGLALRYDSAAGNGPFGLGFSLPLPRLLVSTAKRFARYDGSDTLMLEGAGALLRLPGGRLRPEVDAGAWRAKIEGEGFRLTDRDGLQYVLGTDAAARLSGPEPGQVFAWHLERIEDALGNSVRFAWLRDGRQLYLASMSYGPYEMRWVWEARPDVLRDGRSGFLVRTGLRCAAIELRYSDSPQPLLRRWTLSYEQDAANGASLLASVVLSGFDEAGAQLDTPRLQLSYSRFATRALSTFRSTDPGIEPPPLERTGRRMELVDWDGDGLPDLLEIASGGAARLWPNDGACTWGRPRQLAPLPLFASADSAILFADMNGDGVADLLRADRVADGYLPRAAGSDFERPVRWRQVPSATRAAGGLTASSRLVDLDGDGRVDLLVSSAEGLSLFYRDDPDGWTAEPQQVPRSVAPNVDLGDGHVFLADMSGSGASDLVRVDGRGVVVWPYLGYGRWDTPIIMQNPPRLPFDVRPERLFLSDIDGDGCADLVYLDQGRVIYWLNQCGNGFSEPHVIDYVPTGSIREARIADMRGSGTAGLLWSTTGPFGRGTMYYYLDFTGDAKPHLLNRIDNGVGLVTEIAYTTSAREAVAAAQSGHPWSTRLPVVVPIVAQMTARDTVTGQVRETRYRYFDGRYEGVLREFVGFGRVEQDQIGDASVPTLRTTDWFHVGLDPEHPGEPLDLTTRRRLRALRGRLLRRERGAPDAGGAVVVFDRLEQDWAVDDVPDGEVSVFRPRLVRQRETTLEGAATGTMVTTTNLRWDTFGNVLETVQASGSGAELVSLRTSTEYADDPSGRFVGRPWRTRQFDTTGALIADTVTEFDHAAAGTVGAEGLVTRRSALALTDDLAAQVYGDDAPNFAALGYFRRADSPGWWLTIASYRRVNDAAGLSGSVTGPRGATTVFRFDASGMFPQQLTTPTGNVLRAVYDLRTATPVRLIDAANGVHSVRHDALARLVSSVEPGDTDARPTVEYRYDSFRLPTQSTQRQRAESGADALIETRERFDGGGRRIERRVADDLGDVIVLAQAFNVRGLVSRSFVERRAAVPEYVSPPDTLAHTDFHYDALGRLVRVVNPDGSVRSTSYSLEAVEEIDEEGNRTDAGATHAGVKTRRLLDANRRVRAIEQQLPARTLTTRYEYDIKGNLVRHTDALGNAVTFTHDLLGRKLRVVRPEQTSVTVLDAASNTVEVRSGGARVLRDYDLADRLIRERGRPDEPSVRYTWHDAGAAAPPEGDSFSIGHLVRVEDAGGTTRFHYDARGRIVRKRWQPLAGGTEYALDFAYRSDNQLSRVAYPAEGAARLALTHRYNARGLLDGIPSVVDELEYDLAGRRVRARYANGTQELASYDARGRLTDASLTGPTGVLRQLQYALDHVGNLLAIASPNPKLAAAYAYDDLYRLTSAELGGGETFAYAYDDAGRLTRKSDVGDYRYGEGSAAPTCLTTAGADAFTYTARGEIASAPWGIQTFDSFGRLVTVVARDALGRIDFTYDHAGNRVTARTSGNAAPSVDLITPDALFSLESGALVLHLGGCARLAVGGRMQFLHRDHLGGLVLVTDDAGAVVEERRYDPYGALLERSGALRTPLGFGSGVPDDWSGLVLLKSRYYHPRLGQFVSPDAVIGDVYDPFAWASYLYCRSNPVSFADPSGRSFWRVFILVVAIVALVALTIVTLGATTPLAIGIGIGVLAGGVVGGVSAARAKGDAGDIVTGIVVGAAVGGWAAFLGAGISGAVMGKLGTGILGSAVAGGLSGAVNGGAMGFAAGFGAKSDAADVLNVMWQSALAGLVVGAALGALTGAVSSGELKKPDLASDYREKLDSFSRSEQGAKPPAPNASGTDPTLPGRSGPASPTSPSTAAMKGVNWGTGPLQKAAEYWAGSAGALVPVQVGIADAAGGAWGVFHDDIATYVRRHDTKVEI